MEIIRERGIFAERSFSFYYAGQALSYLGDGLRTLAIPLLVFHVTGSALSLGITYALEFLPFALFGLVGGSLADRLDRRKLMIACDFVRFTIIALFAVGYAGHWLTLPMLYSGIVVVSICAAFFLGGQSPSLRFLLGTQRVSKGVAALMAAEWSSNLVAPPIGGALFSVAGPLPALIVNAFTYLTSQLSLTFIPTLGPESPGKVPSLRELGADIAKGFRFMLADAAMRSATLLSLGLNCFGFVAAAAFFPFLERALGASDAQVGLTLGVFGIGSVAGALVAGKYATHWPFGWALCAAYVIDAAVFMPVVYAHHLWIVMLFGALAGGANAYEIAAIVSWRIRITPEEMIGRVFGAVRLVALIGIVPGTVLGGWLADHISLRMPMYVSGYGFLVLALASLAMPALRQDRR